MLFRYNLHHMPSTVYFSKITDSDPKVLSTQARDLLAHLITTENIALSKNIPLKIHPGAIGNTAYLRPELYKGVILYLQSQSISPYFIETCMGSESSEGKEKEFVEHGFTDLPSVIADGPKGDEHLEIPLVGGTHFKSCLIAKKLAQMDQVLVISHFKGHGMAGFGGALKMLGIGFASGQGKNLLHSKSSTLTPGQTINWGQSLKSPHTDEFGIHDWNPEVLSIGAIFRQRIAEYAAAAAIGKKHLYLTFAINFSPDCDCIDRAMSPVCPDLGILASSDPVAIDAAVLDLLFQRDRRHYFTGTEIFAYAQSFGLGSIELDLVKI